MGMGNYVIDGGRSLTGELVLQGAKNSVLPILAAALPGSGVSVLHGCPNLSDVHVALEILRHLGCQVQAEGSTIVVDAKGMNQKTIPERLMRQMRSSVIFLGGILSRLGEAVISYPGGCELGPRPIDMHLQALEQMNVHSKEEYGCLHCKAQPRVKGAKITLPFPSVGATENIMLAAVTAEGMTEIHHAAREPEIVDLARFLTARGARIYGAGQSTICIEGVKTLHDAEYTIMSDRIAATTYLCGAAMTGGELLLRRARAEDLESVLPILEQMGATIKIYPEAIALKAPKRLRSVFRIRTMPYPGFPTDAQALLMAALTVAEGTCMVVETMFENRYKHVGELCRMGADIQVEGRVAIIQGTEQLYGTTVYAEDLRGGAALVLAGLAASGRTVIHHTHYMERGYAELPEHLEALGARITKEKAKDQHEEKRNI